MLFKETFDNVLAESGEGSKHYFKLPTCKVINSVAMFISNPIQPPPYNHNADVFYKYIFNAIDVSLLLFQQNHTILDFSLLNNEFLNIKLKYDGVWDGFINQSDRLIDINKVKIPVNKNTINNTNTKIIFKKTQQLKEMEAFDTQFQTWQPNVELYIDYD